MKFGSRHSLTQPSPKGRGISSDLIICYTGCVSASPRWIQQRACLSRQILRFAQNDRASNGSDNDKGTRMSNVQILPFPSASLRAGYFAQNDDAR